MGDYGEQDASYEMEPVSDEEKLAIATHMLMSSPPGQFLEILKDVRTLLPDGVLDDTQAARVAKAYNAQEGVIAEADGHGTVLSAEGAVDDTHFRDPVNGRLYEVDHTSAQVLGEADEDGMVQEQMEPEVQQHREALQKCLDAYRTSYFSGAGRSAVCVFGKDGALVAYVAAQKHNLRNWWSGSWTGRYVITFAEAGSADVSGQTNIRGHYLENGNIQLQTSKAIAAKTVSFNDSDSFAQVVTACIREAESELHESLEEMYEKMGDVTLRSMRRAKPITADKFSWNSSQIRMRNTLTQKSSGK